MLFKFPLVTCLLVIALYPAGNLAVPSNVRIFQENLEKLESKPAGWLSKLRNAFCGGSKCREPEIASDFNRINEYLEKEVESDDTDVNLKKAAEWLKEQKKSNGKLVKSLELFVELKSATEEEQIRCSLDSFDILKTNDYATGAIDKVEIKRRIDKIVRDVVRRHIEICEPVYLEKMRTAMDGITDPSELVGVLTDRMLVSFIKDNHDDLAELTFNFDINKKVSKESRRRFAEQVARQLHQMTSQNDSESFLKSDAGRKRWVDEEKFDGAFEKYLVKSCVTYRRKLSEIFEPAAFDTYARMQVLKGDNDDLTFNDKETARFRLGQSRYDICQTVASIKQQLKQDVKDQLQTMEIE